MIGKIERVPLREVWKHEAYDFTTWLQENIDVLSEATGLQLSSPEREQSAGTFHVDIVAEDEDGNPVIVENQLEKSNHDHLGKIITYLTSYDSKTAIWIVAEPRPEHIKAISWLNESTSASFYLFKLEGVKIGNSEPAPLLTLIVGPSDEARELGEKKKEMSERHLIRYKFWEQLLEKAKLRSKLHSQISPNRFGYLSTRFVKSGLNMVYVITRQEGRVWLYIDRGKGKDDENKKIFDKLISFKSDIERKFGHKLRWDRLDNKRMSGVSYTIKTGGYRDEDRWGQVQDEMVDAMCRFEKALKPHISKL